MAKSNPVILTSINVNGEVYGQPVPVYASLFANSSVVTDYGDPPTGQVRFLSNGAAIGTAILPDILSVVPSPPLAVGIDSLTAQYSGDGNYNPATSTNSSQVTVIQVTTVASLVATPNPTTYGDGATLKLTVAANPPSVARKELAAFLSIARPFRVGR